MQTDEYELLKQKMRAIASENLLSWMSDAWRDILMRLPLQDRTKAIAHIRDSVTQHFDRYELSIRPDVPRERADLKLSLFREEFASLSARMLEAMERGGK